MITNTHSVGVVRDAVDRVARQARRPDATGYCWSLPVVAETWDGELNDINGFHVKRGARLRGARRRARRPVAEGNVGGGTGMICYGFKGGIGTASRVLQTRRPAATRSACWCSANYGLRRESARSPACRSAARSPERRRRATTDNGLDHHRRRDRRAAPAAPAQAPRAPRVARARRAPARRRQRLRRHLHRVLDREPGRREPRGPSRRHDAAQRPHQSAVRGDGPGDRGGDRQRAWSPPRR